VLIRQVYPVKAADFEAHKALEPRATSGFAILTI
jgi:hypothetical protein